MSNNSLNHHYPQEYKDGKVTFFSRDFLVTPDVLIPRLETECLVRKTRHFLRQYPGSLVIDVGTGSGIIGTSIADLAEKVLLIDISSDALKIAKKNFEAYFGKQKAEYIVSDLLENTSILSIIKQYASLNTPIFILANLPYIKNNDWIHMSDDTRHEPPIALFGGEKTGFELYERLFEDLHQFDKKIQSQLTIMIEFGFDQKDVAQNILDQYPQWNYDFFADFAGIQRFAMITHAP